MKASSSMSVFSTSLLLLLILCISLPPLNVNATKYKCHPEDRKALFEINAALGNPYHLASWTTDLDCCHWYSIKCDLNTSRVVQLFITAGNISGQIPAAVGDLRYLEQLIFHRLTNVTGEIPPAITKLTNLKFLMLSWLNLTGPVPSFLSKLKNLYFLDLSFNQLTGIIPPELSQLENLGGIRLDRNKLTGTIPESFGHFTSALQDIYLSHNQLSGQVPKSLGNLNLTTIDLSRNKLEGDVSFLLGKNKTVQIVFLSRNLFKFDITKLEFPASLRSSLDLSHNQIFGSLPEGMTELNLVYLNVSYNRLCGQIPRGGILQSFSIYEYFHNRCLCGAPLPPCTK